MFVFHVFIRATPSRDRLSVYLYAPAESMGAHSRFHL